MPIPPAKAPRRPRRRSLALASMSATIVVLVFAVGSGCQPPDPRLQPPTAEQRTTTTLTPTTEAPILDTTPGGSDNTRPLAFPGGPTTVAHARAGLQKVDVYAEPGLPAPTATVPNPGEYGNVQVFVVLEEREDGWLRVLLPVRPNGSSGWIRRTEVDLVVHNYRIEVSLSGFKLKVHQGERLLMEAAIGVGTSDTPTPAATYYTWVLLAPTNSGYGQYAYGLSGFSEVLDEFAGGNARLGIHGTDDESTIGTNVSHGCIRVSDKTVIKMVEELKLPLGVPVSVTA